jgi:hypothetical protein
MTRPAVFAILAAVLLSGAVLLGCPAAHDEYPGLACKTDSDCYGAEHCVNLQCEAPMPDLAMDISFPTFDFAHPVDGGLDGDSMDLSEVDQ